MTRPDDDERLRELITDAAAGVEPTDRLDSVIARTRGRTGPRRSPMRNRTLAVGGAVIGTAAVITIAAWAGGAFTDPPEQPAPAATDTTAAEPEPTTTPTPSTPPSPTAGTSPGATDATPEPEPSRSATASPGSATQRAAGIYFAGDGPDGPRLYREFQQVPADQPATALTVSMQGRSQDPDYRSAWTGLVSRVAEVRIDEQIHVVLPAGAGDVSQRPAGMSEREARIAVQQLVWTVHAYTGDRTPVVFSVEGGSPMETLLGVPANGDAPTRFVAAPGLEVLSHVSITSPSEGATVTDGTLEANGRASSYEATVPWQILSHGRVVEEGFTTAEGWMGGLYPWQTTIDVSDLQPGTYTLRVSTSDASGGREGAGPHTDTRTFRVR